MISVYEVWIDIVDENEGALNGNNRIEYSMLENGIVREDMFDCWMAFSNRLMLTVAGYLESIVE